MCFCFGKGTYEKEVFDEGPNVRKFIYMSHPISTYLLHTQNRTVKTAVEVLFSDQYCKRN